MNKVIYGGDTETCEGEPITFQFYSEHDRHPCDDMIYLDAPEEALQTLIAWCSKRARNVQHVVYIHNLDFDAISFFWGPRLRDLARDGEFDIRVGRWRVIGCYGAPTFFRVSNGHDIVVTFVDSFSWIRSSLARAAELFCPQLPKLKRPAGLGTTRYKKSDKVFRAYAMRDSEIGYHMGLAIESIHREFDIRQCVSIPDMAARIFRHKFVTDPIPLPSKEILEASIFAYHGGKNNWVGKPGWYRDVTALDISSAYPDAMHEFPDFTRSDAYRAVKLRAGAKSVPVWGVYCITGKVETCPWPVLYSHSFKPLPAGKCEGVWVTGYELNEALRSGEFALQSATGFVYDAHKEKGGKDSSFKRFVEEFYHRKEVETDKVRRTFYKLILNSLYGKFIQTRKRGSQDILDEDDKLTSSDVEMVAGGLFHPFIAALITGHTRARIHRLEHEYKALHTSTDGILTTRKIDPKKFGKPTLGSLTVEGQGDALILRNKLYILYADQGEDRDRSSVFKGKYIVKYAMHGFQGQIWELERLIVSGRRIYSREKPNRLKESIKRNLVPNKFESRTYNLKVGELLMRQ